MQAASPMPHLLLPRSPLVPGRSPVRIGYRDSDDGREIGRPDVLVVLHGGWGARIYSFDRQIAALDRHRVIVPDRTGYGASETIEVLPVDFHQRAAEETLAVLDALGLGRASFWGHSDGAVIAFKVALMAPDRVDRIVAEATHFFRRKPRSREFFESMRDRPEQFGGRVSKALEVDHGSRWRAVLRVNGEAWLHLADSAGDAEPTSTTDGWRTSDRQFCWFMERRIRGPSLENSMRSVPRFRTRTLRSCWSVPQPTQRAHGGRCGHRRRAALSRVTRF